MRTRFLIPILVIAALAVVEYSFMSLVHLKTGWVSRPAAVAPSEEPVAQVDPAARYDVSKLIAPDKKYLGVAIDGAPQNMALIDSYAAMIGKRPNMIKFFQSFEDRFAAAEVRKIHKSGALSLLNWEPFDVKLSEIAAGKEDQYVTGFALAVRELNLPVAITMSHEFNGNWYPWGRTNKPEDYVAAWRHIHDIFRTVGATNVIWVWTPNVINPAPSTKLAPFFPGDAYVDWVGVDGYFTLRDKSQRTFADLFGPTVQQIRTFTAKRILIAETGCEAGPNRADQIEEVFDNVRDSKDFVGFVWFNNKGSADWSIDRNPAAVDAYRDGARDPRFGFTVS